MKYLAALVIIGLSSVTTITIMRCYHAALDPYLMYMDRSLGHYLFLVICGTATTCFVYYHFREEVKREEREKRGAGSRQP